MSAVFLFGAGASWGSDTSGVRPPLGAALFPALAAFDPSGWGTITGAQAEDFKRDFERAFESLNPHAFGPLLRAMGAYFFQFVPGPSNLYYELAQRIRRNGAWSVAVCSLNYERLLELSLVAAGIHPFGGSPPYEAPSARIELCLPHGCCHLFVEGISINPAVASFNASMAQMGVGGRVITISEPSQYYARIARDGVPPVMSYFEPLKRTTSAPTFIEGQRARWRELAKAATVLIVIGVRVREHDHHVWDPIANSEAPVIYCAGPHAAQEYEAWAGRTRVGRSDVALRGYFLDEFGTLSAHAGL